VSVLDVIAEEWGSVYDARNFATNPQKARSTLEAMDPPPAVLLSSQQYQILLQTLQSEEPPEEIPEGRNPVSHVGWYAKAPVYVEDVPE
jgi:hypothetical protein